MFDALTDKFNSVFRSLSGRGRITEANVSDALREVRKALLEADVNYQVTKQFCKDVKTAAMGAEVIQSLHPGQGRQRRADQADGAGGPEDLLCLAGTDHRDDGGSAGLG
ncbi:MAG: signal recognition particle receptor subunit alpha [Planctomycetota bacterium]|jgi:signal recognition particle GTPase